MNNTKTLLTLDISVLQVWQKDLVFGRISLGRLEDAGISVTMEEAVEILLESHIQSVGLRPIGIVTGERMNEVVAALKTVGIKTT